MCAETCVFVKHIQQLSLHGVVAAGAGAAAFVVAVVVFSSPSSSFYFRAYLCSVCVRTYIYVCDHSINTHTMCSGKYSKIATKLERQTHVDIESVSLLNSVAFGRCIDSNLKRARVRSSVHIYSIHNIYRNIGARWMFFSRSNFILVSF